MSLGAETPPPAISFALPDGPRMTLRPVRIRDLDGVRALAERAGLVCDELELARLVRSDPDHRLVLCATAPIEGVETILGLGVIELDQSATMPSQVLVDTERTAGLSQLIAGALVERARELADARVA